jgi:Txe/YoeB family toxin of toxin-antitoxin system
MNIGKSKNYLIFSLGCPSAEVRGIGKPETLKYNLTGCWSRRINKEHRIVYEVFDDKIIVHSLKGHY